MGMVIRLAMQRIGFGKCYLAVASVTADVTACGGPVVAVGDDFVVVGSDGGGVGGGGTVCT